MIRKSFFTVTLFFSLWLPLSAAIIETDDIRTILNHVYDTHHHKEILVVFDIDNTIGHVADGFGGDEMFSALIKRGLLAGQSINAILVEVLPVYFKIQNMVWLEPVQQETPKLIRFLQDVGIATMAATSRSFTIIDRTIAQLAHMDINFNHNALYPHNLDLTAQDLSSDHFMTAAYFRHGIIFSGENSKGELLIRFFNKINYWPKKVIFIDDKIKYVEQVGTAMAQNNIPYVGIRYSHLDSKVANYRLDNYTDRLAEYGLA